MMSQPTCPGCYSLMPQTKVVRFPEGLPKIIFECPTCRRAAVREERGS